MPFCQNCGKELQDDWLSCPYCNQIESSSSNRKEFSKKISYGLGFTVIAITLLQFILMAWDMELYHWKRDWGAILFLFGLPFSFGLAIVLNANMK